MRHRLCLLLLVLAGCGGTPVEEIAVNPTLTSAQAASYEPAPGDWPWWRGPERNGFATSATAPLTWGEEANVVWRAPVPGRGHASPVVEGDLVVLSTADETTKQHLMVAYDRASGAEAWRVVLHDGRFPSPRDVHRKATNANGTVAADGERFLIAHLSDDCVTASAVTRSGEVAWQTRLGAFQSKFGYAPSPVLYGGYAIFAADNGGGGYLAAVDRATGEIAWRKKRSSTHTYSSPVVATVAGKEQLLISGGDEIASYDPATGEPLWSCRGASNATCGTIVWNDEVVFASGGYPGQETLAVRADGSAEVLWRIQEKVYEPSLLLVGDALYAANDRGIAYCWDAATGEQLWRKRLGGSFSASPVYCDGRVYVTNADGVTFVFEPSRDGYQELAQNQLGDDTYASPAICDGRVYLRVGVSEGAERQEYLYCLADETGAASDAP